MANIRIRTQFNKSGWRVLKIPLRDKQVCAPANKRYRESYKVIQDEFKRNMHKPWQEYIERIAEILESYISGKSAKKEDRYKILKYLAESKLEECRGRPEFGEITEISKDEQEAWEKYIEEYGKVYGKWKEDLERASYEHSVEKRALWREITDHIHYQYHPEDKKENC